jgi:hypothetical protein
MEATLDECDPIGDKGSDHKASADTIFANSCNLI